MTSSWTTNGIFLEPNRLKAFGLKRTDYSIIIIERRSTRPACCLTVSVPEYWTAFVGHRSDSVHQIRRRLCIKGPKSFAEIFLLKTFQWKLFTALEDDLKLPKSTVHTSRLNSIGSIDRYDLWSRFCSPCSLCEGLSERSESTDSRKARQSFKETFGKKVVLQTKFESLFDTLESRDY